jgi:16S rRNA (guanine527-N7)-methyltransferase
MPDFVSWIKDKVKKESKHELQMVFSISKEDLTRIKRFPKAHNTIY